MATEEGISLDEAKQHIALQTDIMDFLHNSPLTKQNAFVELYVVHKPFQVVLSFDRQVSEGNIRALVPDRLKPYITIESTGRSKKDRNDSLARLRIAMASFGENVGIGYSPATKRYFIDTLDAAVAPQVEASIPVDLKPYVVVNPGAMPKKAVNTNAVPTGFKAGESITAGWSMFDPANQTNTWCTAAFPIKFNTTMQGILTAGQCFQPPMTTLIKRPTYNYSIPDAYYMQNGGNYDIAILRTDGLTTDYQLYYSNPQNTPGYAAFSWARSSAASSTPLAQMLSNIPDSRAIGAT